MTLPQGYFTRPLLCDNVVQRDLDRVDIPQNFALVNHIHVMLSGPGKEELGSALGCWQDVRTSEGGR